MSETIEKNLRFAFTWADATLENDWTSFLGPIRFGGNAEGLRDVIHRYVKLRRNAAGWHARRYDTNNHRQIAKADVLALLDDAQRLDRGESNAVGKRQPGRPRKVEGKTRECSVCGGVFKAKRSTARFCGEACRKRSSRSRNVTLTPLKTLPSDGLTDTGSSHAKTALNKPQIGSEEVCA